MTVSTVARQLKLTDSYGISIFGMLLSMIFGVVALVGVLLIGITLSMRAYGHTTCANWATQTGIPTKFAVLNWADSGSCLAQTPDGRWVLNSNWQAFVSGTK